MLSVQDVSSHSLVHWYPGVVRWGRNKHYTLLQQYVLCNNMCASVQVGTSAALGGSENTAVAPKELLWEAVNGDCHVF